MFGASTNQAASPFSLGGNNASQSTPAFGQANQSSTAGGGLFGNDAKRQSGGLFGSSLNTNNNASGGLFGASSAPKPATGFGASSTAGGLFGSTPAASTNQTQPSGGLFGGQANGAANSGGLLGNSGATGSSNTGGLFGNSSATNTGGLFGANNSANASKGLFGGASNSANTGTSTGLFGAKPSAPATGGLFGNSASSNTNTGLFGGNNNNTSSNLFGGNNQAGQQQSGGLFGSNTNTNTSTGGLFGSQPQQQAQQQQAQLTPLTRFADLPPNMKSELEQLDAYIDKQHLIATTLNGDLQKHDQLIKSIPHDVGYLQTRISSLKQAFKYNAEELKELKVVNDEITEDITNIMQLIVQLATPGTKLSSSFHLNEFFVKRLKKYRELLNSYEVVINKSMEVTAGLELSCNESTGSIYIIVEVVKNQYGLFMELCEVVAQLHGEVLQL